MFEVSADDISLLNDADLRGLVGRLSEAEIRKRGFTTSSVTWSGDQDAPDGGLDVRVELPATTQTEGWVPRPATGFQVKRQKMPPAKIRAEMRPSGVVRPVIQELVDHSGAYIIVSSEDSTSGTALRNRLQAMAEAVRDVANANALTLDFYDRGRLATWVRDHAGLVAWVRERIGKPLTGWRSYGAWADTSEDVSGEYLSDDELRIHTAARESPDGLPALVGLKQIRDLLSQPGTVARLVGLSGVGKTRLLQALFEKRVGDRNLDPASTLYTNVADSPDPQPVELASQLIGRRDRAILAIDNCPAELHRRLSQVCRSSGSTVSVITVEYDIRDDLPEGTEVFRLDTSSSELIEKLIRRRFKDVSATDARTIAKFSDGNARVAIALAGTVGRNETIEGLKDEELLQRLIQQRHGPDQSLLDAAQACSLVHSFDGRDDGAESQLARLGALIGQSAQELYRHVADLLSRGLAQKRGVWRAVLPHAIANRLAAIALQRISFSAIEAQLIDGAPESLLMSFSRRLGYLHTSAEAATIVGHWLEAGGILDNVANLDDVRKAMFQNIAPVVPGAALLTLERCLLALDDSEALRSCTDYVHVLHSLAYDADLFSRCVVLLAKIAAAGDLNGRSNLALDAFASLFYVRFSGTRAPIEQRLAFIRPLLVSGKAEERTLGLRALEATLEAWHFQPFGDFEFGAHSRDYGYWPRTSAEAKHWFGLTLKLTETLACCDEPCASEVRAALAGQFRGIWTRACTYDELEDPCRAISEKQFWKDGWIAVRRVQYHDSKGLTPDVSARLASLEALLRPRDLIQKVRSIVFSDGVGDLYVTDFEDGGLHNMTERTEQPSVLAQDLGKSVVADERAFDELLPALMSHRGHLWSFGRGLAQESDDSRATWNRLVGGLAATPKSGRKIEVLCGFLHALHETNPELVDVLLDLSVQDETAAEWLPALQAAGGIDQRGVERLMSSLSLGLTPIENYRCLTYGGATDPIPANQLKDLVLKIASKAGGFDVATDILHMRLRRDQKEEEEPAPEIAHAGRELIRQVPFAKTQDDMVDYSLGMISRSCLGGEEGGVVVGEVCRKLKDAVAKYEAYAYCFDELIGGLFAAQPTAALDALCGGQSQELESGLGIIRDHYCPAKFCCRAITGVNSVV